MEKGFRPRSVSEIMEEMEEKAAFYTPEWRMDRENPDIGAALAQVYARMQNSMDKKFEKLPEKFRTDFFNCLNTSMKSSAPARGYAVFGLSDSGTGYELPAGTALRTDVLDEYGERIPIETEEDVYVIQDGLEAAVECSEQDDYIGIHYDGGEERPEIPLFSRKAPNLQEHVFYMGHPCILSVRDHGRIHLSFYARHGEAVEKKILMTLADPSSAVFFYHSGEEEIPFRNVRVAGNSLELEKTADMPCWDMTELSQISAFWLGCRVLKTEGMEAFAFEEAYIWSECKTALPERIYADGAEKKDGAYFAFGEQPSLYGEIYFASDEALNKKGALVELSFEQEFARVPIGAPEEGNPIRWKLVMPKDEVRQDKEYEITIEEVVWEYFNGLGWTLLPVDPNCSRLFHVSGGRYRMFKQVEFVCPRDIQPVLVSASESYCIRARIVKLNNAFKTNGYYMAPVLSKTVFRYQYEANTFSPAYFYEKNNMKEQLLPAEKCLGYMKPYEPVRGTKDRQPALYLGFRTKMDQGPIRFLWVMEHDFEQKLPQLSWEYYSQGGWRSLHPADETENLSRTGIVTFQGIPDGDRAALFGKQLYWIRIRDKDGAYKKGVTAAPKIRSLYINAARIITIRRGIEESLTMEGYHSQVSFRLLNRNIHELEVWVLEDRLLGEEETKTLLSEKRLKQVLDADGILTESWVRWERTESFQYHGPAEKCYILDANEGILTFGGGAHGAIPAPGRPDGIRVKYSIGGGKACNLLPGQISGLELSAGFVSMAVNPLALSGGYDRETAREAMDRAGRELKHKFRAVTADDYIALAREAAGDIEKAACYSGLDFKGLHQLGAVTLVLLKRDYETGGPFFGAMKKQVREYLQDKLPAGMASENSLFIREPILVGIELMVTARVEGFQNMFEVRRKINQALDEFLNPVTGNFDHRGWEIGTLPDRMQLETVIKKVPGLAGLKSLVAFGRLYSEPGRPETDLEEISCSPYVLPVSGSHRIRIETMKDKN